MHHKLFGVVLVFAACGAQVPATTLDLVPAASNLAVIRLLTTNPAGEEGQCTAWKVGNNLVATAGHCCEAGDTYKTEGPHASKDASLTILIDDDDHDVCILRGAVEGAVIRLAEHDPAIGEIVWTAGYPRGMFLISDGYWSGDDEDGGVCSVVVNPGASGSPILNTMGEAVGVLVRYMPRMDNLSFVTTLESLRDAVELAEKL